ncbi:dynein axonemal assembly factor 3-like isoform X2 [Glandiceps talaboti]
MVDGFGAITFWGFSPALDLQEKGVGVHVPTADSTHNVLNILLIGAADCRHILKTISRKHRYSKKKINIYVVENNLEIYARHMLLLTTALQSPPQMGLQEKTELFLEIFGNSHVRPHSNQYIINQANKFIRYVTDLDYMNEEMPVLDLSSLKFKERDQLEAIMKFWRNPDIKVFDITDHWDKRVRQHLGVRYDSKRGAFDWDHSMKLSEKGAKIINIHEYCQWRSNGIAFEPREGDYECPNKTLASGLIMKVAGERVAQRGYWGDIVTSPYISYGIECDEESLLKTANGVHVKTARDISEYNILSLLYELTNHEIYVLPKKEDAKDKKESVTLTEITEEEEEEESNKEVTDQGDATSGNESQHESIKMEDVTIYFLPINSVPDMYRKTKYNALFHVVYIANSMVHLLNSDLSKTFTDKASVILETAKFMLDLKKEQLPEFVTKITSMAKSVGCEPIQPCDPVNDCFAKFNFQRK